MLWVSIANSFTPALATHTHTRVFFAVMLCAPAKALSGRAGRKNAWRFACVCFPLCLNTTVAHSIAIASDGVWCVCVCGVVWCELVHIFKVKV
jgi:hypothetical protein